jgi:hypothetical protein
MKTVAPRRREAGWPVSAPNGGALRRYGTGRESTVGDKPTQRDLFLARIQRRRDLAASLNTPAGLEEVFVKFARPGGLAVLKIISGEVVRHGACTLTKDAIADLAGIDRSMVKVALRTAKAEGSTLRMAPQNHSGDRLSVQVAPNTRFHSGPNSQLPAGTMDDERHSERDQAEHPEQAEQREDGEHDSMVSTTAKSIATNVSMYLQSCGVSLATVSAHVSRRAAAVFNS